MMFSYDYLQKMDLIEVKLRALPLSIGVMEYWNDGMTTHFLLPTAPVLHHSITSCA